MHLQILEDYIAELAKLRFENRHEFIETSQVIARLMDIIIEEERRIPDFVVGGDRMLIGQDQSNDSLSFWDSLWDEDLENDISHDAFIPTGRDIQGFITDPGLISPLVGQVTITMGNKTTRRWENMRRLKWTALLMTATLVGLVVGLLTAP